MLKAQPDITARLLDLESLPPLSPTAGKLVNALGDPDLSIKALAQIIETDPTLVARITGLANAAFFAQIRPIYSVEEAMIRVLGMRTVRSLALSLMLAKNFEVYSCSGFELRDYWATALISATLGRRVAQSLPKEMEVDSDEVYLCGLLHGIGELVLVHLFSDKMGQVYQQVEKTPEIDVISLEQDLIGMDHWQAGEWLAVRWSLPESVLHSISYLREHRINENNANLVQIIRACRFWTLAQLGGEETELRVAGVDDGLLDDAAIDLVDKLDDLMSLAGGMA